MNPAKIFECPANTDCLAWEMIRTTIVVVGWDLTEYLVHKYDHTLDEFTPLKLVHAGAYLVYLVQVWMHMMYCILRRF